MSNPPADPTLPGLDRPTCFASRRLVCPTEPNFPLHHAYLEIVYAPLIGPGAVLLARNLGRRIAVREDEVSLSTVELAHEVGLRAGHDEPLGKRSHLFHAIDRLRHDHIIRWLDDGRLGVLTSVPILGAHALAKLPPAALAAHHELVEP